MSEQATVFVIDDDHDARESVLALVRSRGALAVGFTSAEEFLQNYRHVHRGCLVVDVRMAGMSGLQLLEELPKRAIDLPVIIITGFANVPMAVKAMRLGALTFLEKPCPEFELWTSIQEAIEKDGTKSVGRLERDDLRSRLTRLSPDETEVLRRLLEGMPNKRIASELDIGLRTVELRRANVLKKMEADSLAQLVRMAIIAGFPDESE